MFGKKSADDSASTTLADDAPSVNETVTVGLPKGRPTPSRKEAEAARRAALKSGTAVKPKAKPGATRRDERVSSREFAKDQRAKQRAAMLRGDQSAMPARDQGAVKLAVRDYVDSRRCVAEFFVPIAVVVLAMGLVRDVNVQIFTTLVWMFALVIVVIDSALMLFKLQNRLKQKWPDKADRKGTTFYAMMRALQIRKLRLPPTRFKAGGRPVTPKAAKASK